MEASAEGGLGWLAGTIDAIHEGVQVIGTDWRYLYVNSAACRHGKRPREDLLGSTMMACYPGIEATEVFSLIGDCMTARRAHQMENEFTFPDGSRGLFEVRIEPCPEGVFILSVDISEKKRLELQLRQAQKLDGVGKLAGGIAHDFNNLLTAIKSFTEFAMEALPTGHPAVADLTEVGRATDRAVALTRQLLAFARCQTITPRVSDINAIVSSIDKLLRRLLGEDIDIVTNLTADPWLTLIDAGAFEQVLVNLAVNARDAMPHGGRLTIETMNVHLDEAYALRHHEQIAAGEYVVLAVSDDGTGMDAALQQRIFEPFVTTKQVGKGTGLGLSMCYGIVRQADGYIWVYSEPGVGSTFKIYLPRSHGKVEPAVPALVEGHPSGNEIVLIVEDDAQVREVAVRSLSRSGYLVIVAGSGEEALRRCETLPSVDILLTDVVMPGMNGGELALLLSARYPKLKTLYVSGYTESAIVHRGVLTAGAHMLAKPFTPKALARRVREVLDTRDV